MLSGLPGAGKDRWIGTSKSAAPVISLDALREQLGVDPSEPQGQVVAAARQRARTLLRAGEDFVWNATNLSRLQRRPLLDLVDAYGARARIVYLETDADEWERRNRCRRDPVPTRVLEHLLFRWQVPDLTEVARLEYLSN